MKLTQPVFRVELTERHIPTGEICHSTITGLSAREADRFHRQVGTIVHRGFAGRFDVLEVESIEV